MQQKTWLITGISGGLGKALAQTAVDHGDFVIGTFRSATQAAAFNNLHKHKAIAFTADVTDAASINHLYQQLTGQFSTIDILVNNAGAGFAGAIEETSTAEARAVFETNFFGALHITQTFLPLFRKQKSGHIIQVSSHAGVKSFAGFGIYSASKFALEGFSEALALELAPLGIKVTITEPGPLRTNFAGDSLMLAKQVIDDYDATAGLFRERIQQAHGRQEGDPQKAAAAIVAITRLPHPPLRLPLGKTAVTSITAKLQSVQHDLEAFKQIAETAVF